MDFLHNRQLVLTPLSPIHIGCDEDFEPTNYVIDEAILYGFEPALARLPENLRNRLGELGDQADLLGIQRFFREHSAYFTVHADTLIPVAKGLAEDYQRQVGKAVQRESSGNRVFNQLFIERASHTNGQPYIPGSSFKGALRTAWVDRLNDSKLPLSSERGKQRNSWDSAKIEQRLLQGDFATSPLRLVKPADFMPQGDVARQVLYAVNLKKDRVLDKEGRERQARGIAARKECILPGQYRAFTGSLTQYDLGAHEDSNNTPARAARLREFTHLVRDVNRYHLPRLREELTRLDQRGLLNPGWKKAIETLLAAEIEPLLQAGGALLVRLGRYGGAEHKTLSGEGVASIEIKEGKGPDGRSPFQSHTKTVWMASDTRNGRQHLLPFGWALVEVDPQGELPRLRAWCDQAKTGRPDMNGVRARFDAAKARAAEQTERARTEKAAVEAAEQARELAEADRLARLATLSPALQEVESFIDDCRKRQEQLLGGKDRPHTTYYVKARALANQALEAPDWSREEKAAAADAIETWLPQIVAMDIKDLRKKLKLTLLHDGTTTNP